MRHNIVVFWGLALLPCLAQAQNYRQSDSYNGPGVMVNMDVIGVNAPPKLAAINNAPVQAENLPPVTSAPRARPAPVQTVNTVDRSWAIPAPVLLAEEPPLPKPKPQAEPAHFSARQMVAIAPKTAPRRLLGSVQDNPETPAMPVPPTGKMDLSDKPDPQALKPITPPPAMAAIAPATPLAEKIKDTATGNNDYTIYRVIFDKDSDALKPSETRVLDLLVKRLGADKGLTLQLSSFADGTPETTAQARRLSLTRALKLREYLLARNIAATRLDVRALGTGSSEMNNKVVHGSPDADRVDLVLVR